MKKYLVLLLLGGCSSVAIDGSPSRLQQVWEQTYMVGNAAKLANLYLENAVIEDTETIRGRAAIKATLREHLDRYRVVFDEDVTDVRQDGDIVVLTTRFERRLTHKDDRDVAVDSGEREITYVQAPLGWRIQREVWR